MKLNPFKGTVVKQSEITKSEKGAWCILTIKIPGLKRGEETITEDEVLEAFAGKKIIALMQPDTPIIGAEFEFKCYLNFRPWDADGKNGINISISIDDMAQIVRKAPVSSDDAKAAAL